MDPITAAMIAQGLGALIEIWRVHANKPKDWKPTPQDWVDLLTLNKKTSADYKRDAAMRLGVLWPLPSS